MRHAALGAESRSPSNRRACSVMTTCPHCNRAPGLHAKLSLTLADYHELLAGLRREISAAVARKPDSGVSFWPCQERKIHVNYRS